MAAIDSGKAGKRKGASERALPAKQPRPAARSQGSSRGDRLHATAQQALAARPAPPREQRKAKVEATKRLSPQQLAAHGGNDPTPASDDEDAEVVSDPDSESDDDDDYMRD